MINQNGEITKELKEGLGLSELTGYPRRIGDAILPTFETNPDLLGANHKILGRGYDNATGTMTIISSTTLNTRDKKTFITGFHYSIIKDAACDIATGKIQVLCTPKGSGQIELLQIPVITLTAQQENGSINFAFPIELEPATAVTMTGAFGAGVMIRTISIYGYQRTLTGD